MNELKKISHIDKIKNKIMNLLGYKPGMKFITDTKPLIKEYSHIEESKIAHIEEKLRKAIKINHDSGTICQGITETECFALLEWIVQKDRKLLSLENKDILDSSLNGYCGFSQGIISTLLSKMNLSPRISNLNPTISGNGLGGHAFNSVAIPIVNADNSVSEKNYLLDATYRQFFERETFNISERFVKDKRFGGKVSPFAGYFLINLPGGNKFAEQILYNGFCELTPENAKLYGDSFILESKMDNIYRQKYKKGITLPVPKKKDLITGISGEQYIDWLVDPSRQDYRGIDYSDEELEEFYGTNMMKTPLIIKNELSKNTPNCTINKSNIQKTSEIELDM